MEQRTDPVVPPIHAAGTDPAYVPGLTPPPRPAAAKETTSGESEASEEVAPEPGVAGKAVTGEAAPDEAGPDEADSDAGGPEDAGSDEAGGPEDAGSDEADSDEAAPDDAGSGAAGSDDAGSDAEPEASDDGTSEGTADAGEAADGEDGDDGPLFEVSDRRASIIADRTGITLRLDDQEAEFDWDEVGAVEIDTPRFGRRFSITVYTTGRRWYQADVDAPSRSALKSWTAELDAILDTRFAE